MALNEPSGLAYYSLLLSTPTMRFPSMTKIGFSFGIPLQAALPAFLALCPVGAIPARAVACEPDLLAIHDFQVGQVFQYRDEWGMQLARGTMDSEEYRKYRITSMAETPQSRTYRIQGLSRRSNTYPSGLKDTTYAVLDETLSVADSAGHPLNGCPGDTVPMPYPGSGFTRVEAGQGDTRWFALAEPSLRMKRLGHQEVRMPGGPVVDGPRPTRTYAEGLGLVQETVSYLSLPSRLRTLTGYVRDGRIVGSILPDEQLRPQAPVPILPASGFARRAGITGAGPTAFFDLRGRRLAFPRLRADALRREADRPGRGPAGGNL